MPISDEKDPSAQEVLDFPSDSHDFHFMKAMHNIAWSMAYLCFPCNYVKPTSK